MSKPMSRDEIDQLRLPPTHRGNPIGRGIATVELTEVDRLLATIDVLTAEVEADRNVGLIATQINTTRPHDQPYTKEDAEAYRSALAAKMKARAATDAANILPKS